MSVITRRPLNPGHRKALSEVLAFIGNEHATPSDITRKVALSYIDTTLTQRGLAHTTLRDKLVSLGGFWAWMASREAVATGVNPWTGHKLSRQRNKGTRPAKRSYTDAELLKLLAGNDKVKGWPTYSYLPDLMVLGLFTGAREEEICSLTANAVEGKSWTMHPEYHRFQNKGGHTTCGGHPCSTSCSP
jgi:site-specific recombinase XerD